MEGRCAEQVQEGKATRHSVSHIPTANALASTWEVSGSHPKSSLVCTLAFIFMEICVYFTTDTTVLLSATEMALNSVCVVSMDAEFLHGQTLIASKVTQVKISLGSSCRTHLSVGPAFHLPLLSTNIRPGAPPTHSYSRLRTRKFPGPRLHGSFQVFIQKSFTFGVGPGLIAHKSASPALSCVASDSLSAPLAPHAQTGLHGPD